MPKRREGSSPFERTIFSRVFPVFQKTRGRVLRLVFLDFVLADVSEILTLRKVINHANPRWRATAKVNGRRSQRFFKVQCGGPRLADRGSPTVPHRAVLEGTAPGRAAKGHALSTSRAKIKGLQATLGPSPHSRSSLPLPPCEGNAEPTAADPQADQVEIKAAGRGNSVGFNATNSLRRCSRGGLPPGTGNAARLRAFLPRLAHS